MKNLVLVGFMGSGKSTVGKWVAERLGMSFCDMDEIIEQRQGRAIAQIFAAQGEAVFRQIERALAKELASKNDQVIAAGGGAVLDSQNVADFEHSGVVVCLNVDPRIAYKRTKLKSNRPLLEGENRLGRLKKLHKEREPIYAGLRHQVDTSDKGLEAVVDAVVKIYRQDAANP